MLHFKVQIQASAFFSLLALAIVSRANDDSQIIAPENSRNFVGQPATVEFVVHATKQLKDKSCGFINAAKDPTDPKDFTAFITSKAFEKMDGGSDQLASYFLCKVQVTGTIQLYREKPEIVVDSPDQVKIVDRPKPIKLDDAKVNVGQGVILNLTVQGSHEVPGKYCFLDSEADYNDPHDVGIFITSNGLERFAADSKIDHPGDYFLHKKIQVTGIVRLFKERPQIDVSSPDRIRVMGD